MRAITLNDLEIGQIFSSFGLSPIERGMQEIQRVKNPPLAVEGVGQENLLLKIVVSNGTGKSAQGEGDAELERGAYRTSGK